MRAGNAFISIKSSIPPQSVSDTDFVLHHVFPSLYSAVLVYPPSLDFMLAFLACLKAGIIAVPVFPPNPLRRDTLNMFSQIVGSCSATFALTNREYNHAKAISSIRDKLKNFGKKKQPAAWPELNWLVTEDFKTTTTALPPPPKDRSQIAFLQYTSGSTSAPKGVMITHGNLAHNLSIITTDLKAVDDTVVVSWLPQYHDMGLIGSYLGVLYCGGSGYYMSPLSFLQRPMLWIEAISKYRATHLQAPNFALKLTARKSSSSSSSATGRSNLKLDSVRHMINAAEPVDEASIQAFHSAFGKFGFPKDVIYPTYGLAEHTVFVTSGGKQCISVDKEALETDGKVKIVGETVDKASTSRLVGCGFAPPSVDLQIVEPESCKALSPDCVGEIWVRSESKAAGYYQKPEETKHDFGAQLVDEEGKEEENDIATGYLRTGDLGFLHNDELFICGRLKDLIIVGGRNYYPQDIEGTAEAAADDQVRLGCSAAFTIDPTHEGGEEVALIMELKESKTPHDVCASLANQIRGAVNQEHSLAIVEIVFLKPRTVPKTSSGKIARAWCRKAYRGNTLQVVYRRAFKSTVSASLEIEPAETEAASREDSGRPLSSADAAAIRSLCKKEIMTRIVTDVSRVASISPESVDKTAPLVTMMDSLTLSQFKGMLENSYAVRMSDEYLFRESTTVTKLVEVVKLGHAPDDGDGGATGGETANAPSGSAGGLAGALGCPPGVACVIL